MFGLGRKAGSRCTSSSLRLVSSADGHLLLDIEHDRILKLNSVGAEIWTLLAEGASEQQIVDQLSRRYRVNEQTIAKDVSALLVRLQQLAISPACSTAAERMAATAKDTGQLSYPWYGQPDVTKPLPRALTVIWAFVGLFFFDLILRLFSLKVLCWCVKTCPTIRRMFDASTPGKICSAVEQATVWYPKQAVCFQRSAVTTCLLRFYGVKARMMIGIRPLPLQAHSWVEISDAVVNDWRRVSQVYHTATSY